MSSRLAYHTQWEGADINNKGEWILDFIILNRLNVCNIGSTSTFRNRVRKAL